MPPRRRPPATGQSGPASRAPDPPPPRAPSPTFTDFSAIEFIDIEAVSSDSDDSVIAGSNPSRASESLPQRRATSQGTTAAAALVGQPATSNNQPIPTSSLPLPLPAAQLAMAANLAGIPDPSFTTTVVHANSALDVAFFFDRGNPNDPSRKQVCILCRERKRTDPAGWEASPSFFEFSARTSVTALRNHLVSKLHREVYKKKIEEVAPAWDRYRPYVVTQSAAPTGVEGEVAPFTDMNFLKGIVRLLAALNLPFAVVEREEFKQLFRMCLGPDFANSNLPTASRVRYSILEHIPSIFASMRDQLALAPGKISVTMGICLSSRSRPYLVMTAHWIKFTEGQLSRVNCFAGLRPLRSNSKDGQHVAVIALEIMDRLNIASRLGWITTEGIPVFTDMAQAISELMLQRGIFFDPLFHHISSMPHALDKIVKSILAVLDPSSPEPTAITTTNDLRNVVDDDLDDFVIVENANVFYDTETATTTAQRLASTSYDYAVASNPLRRLRTLVLNVFGSRELTGELARIIRVRNEEGRFEDSEGNKQQVPPLPPFRDTPLTWETTFHTIDRARLLRPALDYMSLNTPRLRKLGLTELEWDVLDDTGLMLMVSDGFLMNLAVTGFPSLLHGAPHWESMAIGWKTLPSQFTNRGPYLQRYIGVALAQTALPYGQRNAAHRAYIISIFLNPVVRTRLFKKYWPESAAAVKAIILDEMQRYDEIIRAEQPATAPQPVQPAQRSASRPTPSMTRLPQSMSLGTFSQQIGIFEGLSIQDQSGDAQDRMTPGDEYDFYERGAFAISSAVLAAMTPEQFYTAQMKQLQILYRMFLDYGCIQAAAVPAERTFTLATDVTYQPVEGRCNDSIVEALQFIKFLNESQVLDFVETWKASPRTMSSFVSGQDHLAGLQAEGPALQTAFDEAVNSMGAESGELSSTGGIANVA